MIKFFVLYFFGAMMMKEPSAEVSNTRLLAGRQQAIRYMYRCWLEKYFKKLKV
jgi:hypothetical protein